MTPERTAAILRRGVISSGVVFIGVLLLSLIAASRIIDGLFGLLQRVLLFAYPGADDAALALVLLFTVINMGSLLVLMVGVMAREIWTPVALVALAVLNLVLLVAYGYTPGIFTIGICAWAFRALLPARGLLRANPVMIRELRGRMRGARAFVVMTIYLALMSGFALLLYVIVSTASSFSASAATGQIGRIVFAGVVGIELLLIIFIAPSFTAGAITGERERQTYDLVRTTLLATPSFIIGKLESSLGYIMLLILAAIPLQSIAFFFGGVSEIELLLALIILIVTAITFGTFGIFFSATQPRTLAASVRTYSSIAAWTFIAPLVLSFVIRLAQSTAFSGAGALNLPAVEALLNFVNLLLTSLNPFTAALVSQQLLVQQQVFGVYTVTLASDGSTIPMISPWIVFTALYSITAASLVVLTVRRTSQIDLNS